MPANPPTAPNDPSTRGILLVEEYGGLSAAIGTALRKFAPRHEVRVARNFAEAEVVAATLAPDLFVLDLDPPPPGEIAFLNKLQERFPDARVLVLAAGSPRELRVARGTAGAIQFIEKTFDLADFGAAVQALLGRAADSPSAGVRGTLRVLHVVDIIQLKCLTQSTAAVRLKNPQGETGEIYFRRGLISHAAAGNLSGVPALEEIIGWPRGEISEAELPINAPKTIDRPWAPLLLHSIRKVAKNGRQNSLGETTARPSETTRAGKKILVIDDTEMLLIFVADVLGTADRTFQIITAPTGREGLRLAAAIHPNLILLDYSLTDMNGGDVCRDLLANEVTARIPVLMMSGHLTEMAATARGFRNVVATLAKPFLSGALIKAVDKVLAAGLLPKIAEPAIAPTAPPGLSSSSTENLPNEQSQTPATENNDYLSVESTVPDRPPVAPMARTSPAPIPQSVSTKLEVARVVPPSGRRTRVSLTLAFEVISMQLTPNLRVDTLELRLVSAAAAIKMSDASATAGLALETGFRLGPVGLADGRVDTIRLIPTRQAPNLASSASSFAVGGLSSQPATVQLTGSERAPMCVQLTAQFELLMVELSDNFEVVAALLKSSDPLMRVSNRAGSDGAQFEMKEARLDQVAHLETLFVRAVP